MSRSTGTCRGEAAASAVVTGATSGVTAVERAAEPTRARFGLADAAAVGDERSAGCSWSCASAADVEARSERPLPASVHVAKATRPATPSRAPDAAGAGAITRRETRSYRL